MRILFLLPDFPFPVSTGGRSKVFNELLYLSNQHECEVLSFGSPTEKELKGFSKELPNVKILGVVPLPTGIAKKLRAIFNLIRFLPSSLAAFNDSRYSELVRKHIDSGNYDVIHYDIINMAQYLGFGKNIASVHSPNDATSLVYERLAQQAKWSVSKLRLWISAKLLKRYEKKIYPGFTKVHVVTEVDAAYLKELGSNINTCSIPISLDVNQLVSNNTINNKKPDSLKIVCTGYLGNPAIAEGTRDFIVKVLPELTQYSPDFKLMILGKDPSETLYELMENNENITYFEWVDDFKQFLLQADIILAPDYSGAPGAKTRVLQAMGLALPVIGTRSAFEGIPVVNDEHCIVYDTVNECADLLKRLMVDRNKLSCLGERGFKLVVREFSMDAIGPRYEKMYLEAINDFR